MGAVCCGADDDKMFEGKETANQYGAARLQYVALESFWAQRFSELEDCVKEFDKSIPTPAGITSLFAAWEKAFNELLQSKSNVELLHHYAQLTKMSNGLQMAASTALWAQYQLYQSDDVRFLTAPSGVNEAADAVRNALSSESPLVPAHR